jgi:hypothetical protein
LNMHGFQTHTDFKHARNSNMHGIRTRTEFKHVQNSDTHGFQTRTSFKHAQISKMQNHQNRGRLLATSAFLKSAADFKNAWISNTSVSCKFS